MRTPEKTRVVVIGGGMSGLSTAYELSRTPELRARFDVTVYQMGFRLGGKVASGRNRARGTRNEEHGLHVWFGYYENTFRLAHEVYQRWRKPPDCPFSSVWDFARPQRHTALAWPKDGAYRMIGVHFPRSCDVPGEGDPLPSPLGLVSGLLDVARAVAGLLASDAGQTDRPPGLLSRWAWPRRALGLWPAPGEREDARIEATRRRLAGFLKSLGRRVDRLPAARRAALARQAYRLLCESHPSIAAALDRLTRDSPERRPLHHFVDTTLAFVRGLLHPADGIYVDGDLDRVSDRDFREWLIENGASEESARESAWVASAYDASFQFQDGDRGRPAFEAGTAARFAIRGYLLYKHAPGYVLDAGMGEALVAPLYEVLLDQGVRFEFFHRLERMELSRHRRWLTKLHFARQARAKLAADAAHALLDSRPGGLECGRYQPLFTHQGLRCWPTEPDWDQLIGGDEMRRAGVDFESRWSPPAEDAPVVLEHGRDFDVAVVALPLGSIRPDADGRTPCGEWMDAHRPVRAAAEGINLMPSVGAQLWFTRSMPSLGWEHRPAVIGWAPPIGVWCDMTPVIAHEGWAKPPAALAYLCGVGAPEAPLASSADRDAPARARQKVIAEIASQLRVHGAAMWPGAATPDGGFDWNVLFDPDGRTGPERLAAQYIRVNAEPWDLCDGAAPGNHRLRLAAHDSGLENVALAGTWTRTCVGTSGIETAVISGISAARALGAVGREIVGDELLYRPTPVRPIGACSPPEAESDVA